MKNNEKKTVKPPRIRFNQFTDDWEIKKLGEVCEINPKKPVLNDDINVSFISMASVSEDGFIKTSENRLYQSVKKGYTSFIDRDIIIAKITPCFENGKAALVDNLSNGIGFGSTEFYVLRSDHTVNEEFLFSYLNQDQIRRRGAERMVGNAGQKRVPVMFFENLSIPLPSLEEQEKIAACLSSLDQLIEAGQQRLSALREHKRGLMQSLFPDISNMGADFDKENAKEIPPPANKI